MRFDCAVQCLHVIDKIDFLHEFLITNDTTKLPIIFVNLRVHGETAAVFQSETENKIRVESWFWQSNRNVDIHFAAVGTLPFLLFVLLLIVVGSTVRLKFMQVEEFALTLRARFCNLQVVQSTVFLEQFLVSKCFGAGGALEMELFDIRVPIIVSLVRAPVFHLFVAHQTRVNGHLIVRFPKHKQNKNQFKTINIVVDPSIAVLNLLVMQFERNARIEYQFASVTRIN